MSLTNRLLAYLLSLLAVVLIGFSLGVYLLVNHYMQVESDDRLQSALNTLVGSLDIEPDTVEWEPTDRALSLPRGPLGEEVYWRITDIDGQVIDAFHSPRSKEFEQQVDAVIGSSSSDAIEHTVGWHFERRHILASNISAGDLHRQRTTEEIEKGEYPSLRIVAGISQGEIKQAMKTLLIGLAVLGLALWGVCFAAGRWICRRALRPVTRMAEAAKAMSSEDLGQRLPPVPSGDELATMNRAFNQLLDRLQTSFEQQRRFTGDVSHQLRTPLTIIHGQAEVALRRERSSEEYQEVLRTTRQQVQRLNELVETLLFLARAESESASPSLQSLDLNNWLNEFERTWKSQSADANVRFERGASPALVVAAHAEMLAEVAKNLLDNAIKYSPPGSPIALRLIESNGRAGLLVEDQGSGVSPDEIQDIFQSFFRSTSAKQSNTEGVGLGLSIASRLMRAMNGTIEVDSRPNHGSKFLVWFQRRET